MTEFESGQLPVDDLSAVREKVNQITLFNKRQAKGELIFSVLLAAAAAISTSNPVARREIFEEWADKVISGGNLFVLEGILEFADSLESKQTENPCELD